MKLIFLLNFLPSGTQSRNIITKLASLLAPEIEVIDIEVGGIIYNTQA